MSTTTPERHEFQTEVRQLLDLMIHSLYSHKDIFLRELISNASDALDKLRFEALTRPELQPEGELEIRLEADPEKRTLTVWDNGIGMSREEVVAEHRHHRPLRHARVPPGACGTRRRSGSRADRPVRRGLLLELHGGRAHRARHAQGRRGDGHALGVDGRRLPAGRRRAVDAGHHRHAAPQAQGRRGRAARLHRRARPARHRPEVLGLRGVPGARSRASR